jgi:hypothetical protein|tara:strand:+ start:694 stop:984 length:291 start_codon:yes stop_codon:yes gene_type:complete
MNEKEKSGAITQEEWDNIVLQKNIEKENFTNEEISQIDSFLTFNEKFFTKILKVSKEDYRKLDNVFGGKMTDILEEEKANGLTPNERKKNGNISST